MDDEESLKSTVCILAPGGTSKGLTWEVGGDTFDLEMEAEKGL